MWYFYLKNEFGGRGVGSKAPPTVLCSEKKKSYSTYVIIQYKMHTLLFTYDPKMYIMYRKTIFILNQMHTKFRRLF